MPGGRRVRVVPRVLATVVLGVVLGLTLLAAGSASLPGEFIGPQGPSPEWPPAASSQHEPAP